MRRPSSRAFKSQLTLFTKTSKADDSGDSGLETYSSGTNLTGTANVQLDQAERAVNQGKEQQITSGKIVFRTLPVDLSPDARSPGLPQIRDKFTWVNDLGLPVTLYAMGPAVNECDRGQAWVVKVESRGTSI